jgi:hypothetical protein
MPQSCTKLGPVQRRNLGAEPAELGQAGGQADGIEPLTLRFSAGRGTSGSVQEGTSESHSP